MEKKRFRLGKALSFVLELVLRFPKYFLLPMIVQMVFTLIYQYMTYNVPIFKFLTRAGKLKQSFYPSTHAALIKNLFTHSYLLISVLLALIILSGYIRMVKKWMEEKMEPEWKDFFSIDFALFIRYVALSIILGILGGIGFFILIIPAFVVLTIYIFSPYVLIDQRTTVGKAMNRSADLANGIKGPLFWTILLYGILVMGPSFYLSWSYYASSRTDLVTYIYLFSLFTTLAGHISQLATAYLYRDLSTQQDAIDNKTKEVQ
jgi:hypothetical protein